jgi:hypothetical protein
MSAGCFKSGEDEMVRWLVGIKISLCGFFFCILSVSVCHVHVLSMNPNLFTI